MVERLTEEMQIGPFATLKDKAESVPGAFATYDCLYAHMVAVTRLKEYEDAMPLERAKELAQAEKDGRLVVLPCNLHQTLYILKNGEMTCESCKFYDEVNELCKNSDSPAHETPVNKDAVCAGWEEWPF